ncbi:MAG: helix-turn-helix domain-containing protein [Cetobacterium sp.]
MSLKRKELEVLKLVLEKKSFEEIVVEAGMGERNLRYILQNLNFYLHRMLNKIVKKDKEKLLISLCKDEVDFFLKCVYKNFYILDNFERVEYIIVAFLFSEDTKLITLEDKLGITRATLKKDIKNVNLKLEKFGLQLISEKNKFCIKGNEKKLRHLQALKYLEYGEKEITWLDNQYLFSNIDKKKLDKLKEIVLKTEKDFSLTFDKEFIRLMVIYLYVTIERIENGGIIERKANYKFLINTEHYFIVEKNLNKFIRKNLTFELVHLTEYFISGGVKSNFSELRNSINNYLVGLENRVLDIESYSLDGFRFSEDFKMKLTGYLIPAFYRLKNNISIGETGDKGKFYSLVFEYSKEDNFLTEKLTSSEICYISKELEKEVEKESQKIIKLSYILNIIEKNSKGMDRKNLIKDLIGLYGKMIKIDVF